MRGQPERSWGFLLGSYLSVIGVFFAWVLFLLEGPVSERLSELSSTEGGSIAGVLLVNLPLWALIVFVLVRFGRFRMSELGIKRVGVRRAAAVTAILWAVVQATQLVAIVLAGDSISLRLSWLTSVHGVVPFLVGLLAVAFGEELFFRGFFQSQLSLKVSDRPAPGATAVLLASAAFALAHLPRLWIQGQVGLSNLSTILVSGIVLGALFYVSRNLYLSIGVHALFNWPVLLFDDALNHTLVLSAVALAFTAILMARTSPAVPTSPCAESISR